MVSIFSAGLIVAGSSGASTTDRSNCRVRRALIFAASSGFPASTNEGAENTGWSAGLVSGLNSFSGCQESNFRFKSSGMESCFFSAFFSTGFSTGAAGFGAVSFAAGVFFFGGAAGFGDAADSSIIERSNCFERRARIALTFSGSDSSINGGAV
ncbi:MAG: hypothetical protein C4518_16045 [Desulfobacteraceae bacterium]|nr:MAG: hypothetical protein C4518_16045 [Desulfobacteraceae bacterium]